MGTTLMNWPLLQNTLLVGISSTLIAMCFGLLVAMLLSSTDVVWRNTLLGLALVTLALPPFLITNAWMYYLGESGPWHSGLPLDLYSPMGAVLILSFWLWPVTALAVWSAWQRLEPAHLEAEPDLRGWALIRFLLIPMARGSLVVAGLITLVLAANNLAVPALLQVHVYPAEVWLSFSSTFWMTPEGSFDWLKAVSLSWPLVVLPVFMLMVLRQRGFNWPTLRGGTPPDLFRRALGLGWLCGSALVGVMVLSISVGLPLWQLVGSASTWSQLSNALAAGRGAILTSLGVSAVVATFCAMLALLNVVLASNHFIGRHVGRTAMNQICLRNAGSTLGTLLWLPFLVPGVLIGIVLIQLLNRPGLTWLYQSLGVVILALTIRYLAIGWSVIQHALRAADPDLGDAARLDGASGWQLLRHVLWPQIAPQVAGAWCVVFLLCLWDVETLVLIIPPGGETIALRVFNLLHYGHTADVNALCLILLGLAVLPLLVVAALLKARSVLASGQVVVAFAGAATLGAVLPLLTGCSPKLASNEARVDSQFFDRVQIIATRGVAPGQVNKPRSVAVDHDDNLFVLDYTGRVQKFSPEGDFLLFWQMPETKRGNPKGLSVDPDGNIIVVEPHYSRVNLFTPEGQLLMQWGEKGTNGGQFSFPRSAAVNSKREWYLSEFGLVDRVQKFAFKSGAHPGLRFLEAIGQAGAGPGEFNRPEGLCVDAQDQLLVADAVNHRIQVFDAKGQFAREFGHAGNAVGELSYPYDLCVDSAGREIVCEFGNSRIQIFDPQGHSIEILGGPGAAPGFFNNPWGVALDSQGNLYVADSQNHRVQKFVRKRATLTEQESPTVRRDARASAQTFVNPQSAIGNPQS